VYRFAYSLSVAFLLAGLLASCDNRGDDPRSEADKKAGRVLERPGDSVRLEDTLSIPPASTDTAR
jgi:hypothetical protein